MKRFFTLLLLVPLFSFNSFSSEAPAPLSATDTFRIRLSYTLTNSQMDFKLSEYPLLVYLCRKYNPDSLKVKPLQYRNKLNDYYYRRYCVYGKLIDSSAFITSDCLSEEESGKWHPLKKLMFYGMYSGPTWEFPKNYAAKMAEYATEDTFYGPLNVLLNLYVLKEFNWNKISNSDKKALRSLEDEMAASLYKHYIQNRDWGYFKVYALWAIRINGNPIADHVDISPLTGYFDRTTWMMRFPQDFQNEGLMNREGGAQTTFISNLCTYWLYLLLTKSG